MVARPRFSFLLLTGIGVAPWRVGLCRASLAGLRGAASRLGSGVFDSTASFAVTIVSPPEAKWLQDTAHNAEQAILANSREVQVSACRAGLGLACLPIYLAEVYADLVAVAGPKPMSVRGVWLGVHKDMRNTPRIRVVLEMLTAHIKAHASELAPPESARARSRKYDGRDESARR